MQGNHDVRANMKWGVYLCRYILERGVRWYRVFTRCRIQTNPASVRCSFYAIFKWLSCIDLHLTLFHTVFNPYSASCQRSLRPCFRWVQGQEKGMFSYGGQAATYMHVSHRHKKAQVENKRQNKEQINRVLSSRVSKEKLCFVFVLILCLLAQCIENEA